MELKVLGQDNQSPGQQSGRSSGDGCASGTCGSSEDAMGHLPESVREKVHNHPCYSEEAHHYYARMHVAVAPACNIQCHFCNRKYDCANESRPGVVSELLSPDQAAKKVLAVASEIPQMTVLGVAGPGDPLANPERTFETFRKIVEKAPDIKLCLSTNGLALPDHVDEIVALNVDHVTITINCVDPLVGEKIYPWVFWNHKRVKGIKGAKILIERQQKGLEMLIERGVLVKVNSVMIPGVNDKHLQEVSRIVKTKGAFLHNVMPLISEPEHGTFYGLMGQRGPNKRELSALQDACAGDMNMMRHCRQCRADAVGLLGEDRGQEFTLDKVEAMKIDHEAAMEKRLRVHEGIEAHRDALRAVKTRELLAPEGTPSARIAVTTKGDGVVNQHFGHATEFLIYEVSPEGVRLIGPRKIENAYCVGPDVCPEGAEKGSVLDGILEALADCSAVVSAKIGIEPWEQLEDAGILPSGEYAWEPIEDALKAMYRELVERGHVFKDLTILKAAG